MMRSQQMLAKYAWLTPRLVATTAKSTMSTSLISLTVSLANTPPHTHTHTKAKWAPRQLILDDVIQKRAENNLIKTDFYMFSPVSVWAPGGRSSFLPQSKDMRVNWRLQTARRRECESDGCLYVGLVMNWRPVQGGPRLTLNVSRDWLQLPPPDTGAR